MSGRFRTSPLRRGGGRTRTCVGEKFPKISGEFSPERRKPLEVLGRKTWEVGTREQTHPSQKRSLLFPRLDDAWVEEKRMLADVLTLTAVV